MRCSIFILLTTLFTTLQAQTDLPEILSHADKFDNLFEFIRNNDTIEQATKKHLEDQLTNSKGQSLYHNYIKLLLAKTYRKDNVKKSNEILDEVKLYLQQNNKYVHLQLFYNVIKARILYEINQNCNAAYELYLENYSKINFYKSIDKNWNIENETKTGIITSLLCLGKDQQALDSLKKLELEINPNDYLKEYVFTLSTIGYIHTKFKNYKDGETYFKKIINLLEDKKDLTNNYIAVCNNLAYIYRTTEKYDESIEILEKGLAKAKQVNDLNNILLITNNLGFNYLQVKNYAKAIKLGEDALEKSASKEYRFHKANANRLLGYAYYHEGNYQKSESNIDSALVYFHAIKNMENYRNCLNIKAKLYLIRKDYVSASKINNEIISLLDSVNLSKQYESLQKNLVEYESEKKDAEITILTQKDEINSLKIKQQSLSIQYIIIAAVLLVILAFVVFIYQRRINRINNLALRSKLARAQFNPHFINNALSGIQTKLLDQNDESLLNYVSSVSRLTRFILESTFREEWTLNEEIQMIRHYVDSMLYKLNNGFIFRIHNELNESDLNSICIPSAITQIPIENAIIHGGYETMNGGEIDFIVRKSGNQILITINNSILNSGNSKTKQSSKSRGLELTQKRIETHCVIHKSEGFAKISITENMASVQLALPLVQVAH